MSVLRDASITSLAGRIATGEVRAVEVAEAALARIASLDQGLGALLSVTADDALAAAHAVDRARDEGAVLGKLAGVPIAVKDALCMKGVPTTCASRILEGYIPPYEATVVTRLRQAGALLVGKANMDEFAMGSSTEHSAYFNCKNPWDTTRSPGGSSGGSAVAVAARFALGALGSDTGGSIRQPAAYTGTVGLKPTYGRVSRYGLVAFASSLDQVGAFATDVRGAARVLSVIAGPDGHDATCASREVPDFEAACTRDVRGLRIGVLDEAFGEGLADDARAAFEASVEALTSLGCTVERVSLPSMRHAVATYYVLATAEASSNLARFDGVRYGKRVMPRPNASLAEMIGATRDAGFGAEVKRRILLGTFVLSADAFEAYYVKAQKVRRVVRDELLGILGRVDAVLSPTTPTTALPLGAHAHDPLAMYLSDVYTLPASLAGLPAMSVPCALSPSGLPLGLQIVGRPFDEETVIALGAAYEAVSPFAGRRPPCA
jgi:aspartyl-tRNA(Asn)/glutamyl-tRNA(Gln) amidotransferase subunit A